MTATIKQSKLLLGWAGLLACLVPIGAMAQKTWTGQSSNQWTTSSNWSPSGEPGADDNVIIDLVNPNSPVISSGSRNTALLNIGVDSTGNLTVINGAQLRTQGIRLGNNASGIGLLTLTGDGTTMSPADLFLPVIFVGFNGTGLLDVRDGATISGNYDFDIGKGELLVTDSGSSIDIRPVTGRRVWIRDNGQLRLAESGILFTNGTVEFRGSSGAPRRLVFGAPEGSPPTGSGLLAADQIEVQATASANSAIVFNHTGTKTLGLDIQGPGRIRQISGDTIYTGTAGQLQGTFINGFLQIGDGGTSGTLSGPVDNQGTLNSQDNRNT